MTTTLTPTLGAAPLYTLGGTGASPGYNAIDLRRASSPGLQEGVMAATSMEVTVRAAGANMSVDIAASTGENGVAALVQGDSLSGQGLYVIPPHSAVINEVIGAAHATLPRVDRVILEVLDNQHDSGGSNLVRTRVVAGTATAGATLDNLTGAAAVPSNALLLADVLVAAADTAIGNTEIRDRRKWARGAYKRSAGSGSGAYTTTSGTPAEIDTTNLRHRIECSGNPIRVSLYGLITHTVDNASVTFQAWLDGAITETATVTEQIAGAGGGHGGVLFQWEINPSAGSHRISVAWSTSAATASLSNSSGVAVPQMVIEEIIRQDRANNATTSG